MVIQVQTEISICVREFSDDNYHFAYVTKKCKVLNRILVPTIIVLFDISR